MKPLPHSRQSLSNKPTNSKQTRGVLKSDILSMGMPLYLIVIPQQYQIFKHQMQKKLLDTLSNQQFIEGISAIGPNSLDLSLCNNQNQSNYEYTIKVNGQQGELHKASEMTQKPQQKQVGKISTKNVFNVSSTGYDINREIFTDDDIREAFNTIDINNDGVLTAEELSFFLKCMNQPHNGEEVEEMIRMVSNDGQKVVLQEFRKIGKGKLPPFAAVKEPTPQAAQKQNVMETVKQSVVSKVQPQHLLEAGQELDLSRERFQQEKVRKKDHRQVALQTFTDENGGFRIRSTNEIKHKKQVYSKIRMLNVDYALQTLKGVKQQTIDLETLADLLSISEEEAKVLFEKQRIAVRQVILDYILFSQCSNLKKIELILINRGHRQKLSLEEWVNLLSFMIGLDSKKFIRRRLESILKHRKINPQALFDRYFILQIMTDQYNSFLW